MNRTEIAIFGGQGFTFEDGFSSSTVARVFDTRSDTINSRQMVRYHQGILPNGYARQLHEQEQTAVTIDTETRSVIRYDHKSKILTQVGQY